MSEKQWEPLTTAEAVIEAIKAGRHVEFTSCGCDYSRPGFEGKFAGGWIIPEHLGKDSVGEDEIADRLATSGTRYRALIAPAQPAGRPMNIIEEAKRLLKEHRGLHPEIHAFIRAVAGLEPVSREFQDRQGKWCGFLSEQHFQNTLADGSWPIRHLYILEPTND